MAGLSHYQAWMDGSEARPPVCCLQEIHVTNKDTDCKYTGRTSSTLQSPNQALTATCQVAHFTKRKPVTEEHSNQGTVQQDDVTIATIHATMAGQPDVENKC